MLGLRITERHALLHGSLIDYAIRIRAPSCWLICFIYCDEDAYSYNLYSFAYKNTWSRSCGAHSMTLYNGPGTLTMVKLDLLYLKMRAGCIALIRVLVGSWYTVADIWSPNTFWCFPTSCLIEVCNPVEAPKMTNYSGSSMPSSHR